MNEVSGTEQQAISLLAHLAKASTLEHFILNKSDVKRFFNAQDLTFPLAVRNQQALQALLTALAHGYRLFLQEQHEWATDSTMLAAASLETLHILTSSISSCLSPPNMADKMAVRTQFSVLSVSTGGQLAWLDTEMPTGK